VSGVVLDASVAVKWFVDDVLGAQAVSLIHAHDYIAPPLLLTETANALWKYARRGDVVVTDIENALERLDGKVDIANDLGVQKLAARLACKLGHPVYDCTYLALAQMRQLPILSADKRLLSLAQDKLDLDIIDLAIVCVDE
jgi:predicted nucleic acid-binding protein